MPALPRRVKRGFAKKPCARVRGEMSLQGTRVTMRPSLVPFVVLVFACTANRVQLLGAAVRVAESLHRLSAHREIVRSALAPRVRRCGPARLRSATAGAARPAPCAGIAGAADREARGAHMHGLSPRRIAAARRRCLRALSLDTRRPHAAWRGVTRDGDGARPGVRRLPPRSSGRTLRCAVGVLRRHRALRPRVHGVDARPRTPHRVRPLSRAGDRRHAELHRRVSRVRDVPRASTRWHSVREARVRELSSRRRRVGRTVVRSRRDDDVRGRGVASSRRVRELPHAAARRGCARSGVRRVPRLARSARGSLRGDGLRVLPRPAHGVRPRTAAASVEAQRVRSSPNPVALDRTPHHDHLQRLSRRPRIGRVRHARAWQGLPGLPRPPRRPRSEVHERRLREVPCDPGLTRRRT